MRINGWYATLGIVSVLTTAACSSSSSGGTTPADDAATPDDTGTTTPDTGSTAPDATPDAAVVCDVPDGSDSCDTCALQSCCATENACQNEPTDAATTECEDIFACVQDCLTPPADSGVAAGSLSDCTSTCGASHSSTAVTDFSALAGCLAGSCSTQCM